MGYTMEKGKAIIWTSKIFEADEDWPNDDEGENYTYFYKNLYDNKAFATCLARLSDEDKKKLVSDAIDMPVNKFILKSKKQHYNQNRKA